MQAAIIGPTRTLAWMFVFQKASGFLRVWTGDHTITWDGEEYLGVGRVAGMSTQRKPDAMQHVEHTFTLSGLDPSPLADLDESVRGREGAVYLAALNERRQVIPSPILLTEIVQDTLKWERASDDTVTLTLAGFEALPFLGRATGDKYSHEKWLAERDDEGMYFTSPIALAGRFVEWRP
jgi:hypothetical protein